VCESNAPATGLAYRTTVLKTARVTGPLALPKLILIYRGDEAQKANSFMENTMSITSRYVLERDHGGREKPQLRSPPR
jgi:hypothetical protein